MQVICPNCGEKVTADHINIQKMTAVCGSCDTVFVIELPEAKSKTKRRKVKQPDKLTLRDAETLHMEFRTNFRLERNEAFFPSVLMATIMTIVGGILLGEGGGVPFILPVAFLVAAVGLWYFAALIAFNKTYIDMDEDTIKVTRKPLPNPLGQAHEVPLGDVETIRCEETDISKKESYDTPRYRVWAQTADGTRRTIVNDLTEEYAVFIAQHLEKRLQADAETDDAHLEAGNHHLQDQSAVNDGELTELLLESRNRTR